MTTTLNESGYTGVFSERDTCSGIATVSPPSANGPSAVFTVTGAAAGACSVTFTDATAQSVTVQISVTTAGFNVQSRARN